MWEIRILHAGMYTNLNLKYFFIARNSLLFIYINISWYSLESTYAISFYFVFIYSHHNILALTGVYTATYINCLYYL